MLSTPFVPLADAEFQSLVSSGEAIPCQQGTALLVSKWRDGPGLDAATFLAALKSQGSTMEIRRYRHDVHIRVVRGKAPARASTPARARRSPK